MIPPTFLTQRDLKAKSRVKYPEMGVAGGLGKLAVKMHLFGKHVAFTGVLYLFDRTRVLKAHSPTECAVFPWIMDL